MHMCSMNDGPGRDHTAWLLLLYYSNPNLENHLPDCESSKGALKRSNTACYILAWFDLQSHSLLYSFAVLVLTQWQGQGRHVVHSGRHERPA
jgi:hypothetical protein